MNKTEALKLLREFGRASIRTFEVVNGISGGKVEVAIAAENRCARKLLKHLGVTEEITDQDILESL
jgi:hypothetical protein